METETRGETLKRTPLYAEHQALGARFTAFGGWEMPVQYSGIVAEHLATRERAGLFDLSHMGEFYFAGPGAEAFLQRLTTNDVGRLSVGQAQYSMFLHPTGGVVDDIVVYRRAEGFMVVVNGANVAKDWAWVTAQAPSAGVELRDGSEETALLALQGPRAAEIMAGLVDQPLTELYYYRFLEGRVAGIPALLARTGYTGEDGFEVFVPAAEAAALWRKLLLAGEPRGLVPVGLGARDTLRLEMAYPLYGNDLTDETTPLEAGLNWVVKLEKGEFIGREALLAQRERGLSRRLAGLVVQGGIARHGYTLRAADGQEVGTVTSGSFSPTRGENIGLGYLRADLTAEGSEVRVDIRGRLVPATVVRTPFVPSHTYRPPTKP
ncbi:MAG TPA: glycine cleavage system aminomethyltransferase GcvT [Firmicutes bacterium]|nr:glycine cleavage system aminomethyltransferase GcvT [Bacillota bacterium]